MSTAADPFHGVSKCDTTDRHTADDLRQRSKDCPANLYQNAGEKDLGLADNDALETWKKHLGRDHTLRHSNIEHCITKCNMFPNHKIPTVRARAGLPSIGLLAHMNNNNQFVQLPTHCRGLGNFGPDLPKIAQDILHDPGNALGPVACSALIYETHEFEKGKWPEQASVLYEYTSEGTTVYCVALTVTFESALLFYQLCEPKCQPDYEEDPSIVNDDALTLVGKGLYHLESQLLVNFYTGLQLYQKNDAVSSRRKSDWDKALQANILHYGDSIEKQQDLYWKMIHLLNKVQKVRVSIASSHGHFKLGLCAFTGINKIVQERPGLFQSKTLQQLNLTIRKQSCYVELMTPHFDDDALWIKEQGGRYTGEPRPITLRSIQLVSTSSAEKQIALENPRVLSIPDRMRAAKHFLIFEDVLPWTRDSPPARQYLDTNYDRIAALCFSVGRDAWMGKFKHDPDATVESGDPQKKKRSKESALTTHNIISMTRYKGLHLLNHYLMKQGAGDRPELIKRIVPFGFQEDWYKQADRDCKTWRKGKTKVQSSAHIIMQDCAVVAVYVTYTVGLWLMSATPEDWQAWNNLMLHWHKQCLNTNKPKRAVMESSTCTSSNTNKKKSKNPNTTGQRLMHATCDVPNDANKPIRDIRLTPEELSCEFMVRLLEELWFPVIALLEAIRQLPMLYGAPDAEDEPKHDFKKSKYQWAEQIVIARLLCHLITLRNDEDYQHGVEIGSPTPTPLHVIMKQLAALLDANRITVYLPDLLGPDVEQLAVDQYYHPHQRLRIEQFRIQFAPLPSEVTRFNNGRRATRSTGKETAEYEKPTPGPLTFLEILKHCVHFAENDKQSIWTDLMQIKPPAVRPPESMRKRKKKKRQPKG